MCPIILMISTGSLEGQHYLRTKDLVSLSEQNLIDCSTRYGNNGCEGGQMNFAFTYIKHGGIGTEARYPYMAEVQMCKYSPRYMAARDKGYKNIASGDEDILKAAVATVGPISVAIDASHETFQLYSEGLYYEPKCSSTNLNHGVLVVGYGTDENKQDYWLVKNSWGVTWGEQGYIKMARNINNMCGIRYMASFPVV